MNTQNRFKIMYEKSKKNKNCKLCNNIFLGGNFELYCDPCKYKITHRNCIHCGKEFEIRPVMTLHFYAPIYMLLTVCDREPEREQEALKLIEGHIRQFDKLYGRNF